MSKNDFFDFPLGLEVIRRGDENGYMWAVARAHNGHSSNGYVRLPDGHPWLMTRKEWDIETVGHSKHGGITYRQGNWIGFDTDHYNHVWADENGHYPDSAYGMNAMFMPAPMIHMTDDLVTSWTRDLALEGSSVHNAD